uniref:Peptidase S1 domain-containing protein n=1 Tax=Graphocephala atropunctata TaxID=36148 RepID=A0A1B6L129_9HEMI
MTLSVSCRVFLCVCIIGVATSAHTLLDLFEGDSCKTVSGTQWTCKRIRNCKKAIQMVQSGARPQICSFDRNEPIVCCEPVDETTTSLPTTTSGKTTTSMNQQSEPGLKAHKKCQEYANFVYVSLPGYGFDDKEQMFDTCNTVESLVVGGQNALPREFPHMAQIGYGEESKIGWRCGGSLISRNYVLSAAHCTTVYREPASWVRLGEYNTRSTVDDTNSNAQPVIHRIQRRINHPEYRTPVAENDIALYQLETDVVFNEFIRPACLQTDTQLTKPYAVATGWGNTEYGGKSSDVLQKVNLTLVSQVKCSDFYKPNEDTLPRGVQPDSMLCAGDTNSGRDSCQGDSGGPLQVSHPQLYCTHSIVGVTSFGRGCGVQPGVYTRVSHFIPWIESIVWQ